MPALPRTLLVLSLLLGAAASAPLRAEQPAAQDAAAGKAQAQRQESREQIQRQRKAAELQRGKDEAACYQQFAVEDCLRSVRAKAREADKALRSQELQLNDAERREKAGQRLRTIEEKQQEQRERLESGERPAPMRATSRTDARVREQEARQRADNQRRRAAEHAADAERRKVEEPGRISESRARYEAKQQKARERRERHERQQAEAAASGRSQPASLPTPGVASDAPKP